MKKYIGLTAIVIILFSLYGCNSNNNQQAKPVTPTPTPATASITKEIAPTPNIPRTTARAEISIENFSFNSAAITIDKGTTVTWTNNDSAPHQIKSDTFNSGTLSNGQSYSNTFNDSGTFNYSCAIHPSMTGSITVK
jgi:plastocyanin